MAVMSQEIQDLFNSVPNVAFCTASSEGQPNANIIGMKFVIDEETLYVSDQFFTKTLANLKQNTKVSLLFWENQTAYQIYGTARYVNEGEEFEAMASKVNALFEQFGLPITAKGGAFVHVDAIYSACSGPEAGKKLA